MPLYAHKGVTPRLGERVYLAPNATVIGDVVLGDDSSVWFGAVIRGDVFPIRIGARTNIQDNAVVHVTGGRAATTIGDDVTVGHLALVHGATVGSRCLVGMGSIVLDGAVVEDDCFIAAGALVPPGMRVASRSMMVGRPARVARTLSDADLAEIAGAGGLYVQYAREFATDVKPV
ncbi:MAG: gamma carbonic anhydrase family protein [Labilithrix sp.]|nr:gamma carbonic anhydrase family protein [Labilithrix sp.]MBX3222430.1 gamma carbonic anhydrase family protein [Labilithrix sp.]